MVGKKPKDMVLYIFVCQAGDVRMIRSDNGSNLVGASTELTCELQEMNHIKKKTVKNNHAFAISFVNQRGIKNQHDRVIFQILYPTIYSNKYFELLKF